jgi:hypothetical protein
MNPADFTTVQLDFLSRFFGPGNKLRWKAFCDGSMSEQTRQQLSPFIDDLRQADTSVLLPHVSETSPPSTTWYGLASDARQARALKEQLTAFVGPTWTDFTGQQALLDDQDPIEATVKQYFAPHAFRLRVLNFEDRQQVHQQIERMRDLRDRYPGRTSQLLRPIGRILRDLEMALVVRNESTARECLDDLRSRGRLSAHNLTFLNVRILAAFERWSELRTLPTYRPLFDNRRPARVTEALIRCVYDEHFVKFESEGNVADCIAKFTEKESTFGTLFRTRGPLDDPAVVKAWLLRAVSRDDRDQAQSLLNAIPVDHSDRVWAESLAGHLKSVSSKADSSEPVAVPSQSVIDQARQALNNENFDAAFEFLLQCEPTVDVIRQLITCADEINTLTATRQVVTVVEAAPEEVRAKALSRRVIARVWEHLAQPVTDNQTPTEPIEIPDDWHSWLHLLNTTGPWPNAVEIAQQGCLEWSIAPLRSNPSQIEQIADQLITSRSAEATAIVRTILPELIGFFLPEDGAIREFKPIYMSLIYLLSLDDGINGDDLTALETLAEAVLESAPGTSGPAGSNEYVDLLESIEAAWQQVRAFRHVDWAMSILDLLIAFNVRQHAPVDRFLHNIVDGFRDWSRRIREDQWDLIDLLSSDLNQSELLHGLRPVDESQETVTAPRTDQLKGKTVAIYTLTERIGQRAAQLIERAFEGVKVQLLHDKVASDRLIQLAKTADVFIVNTWDAKHAATGAIHAHRGPKLTVVPQSKSAAAVLRELFSSADVVSESR